jgi:hypothetical protein
MGGKDFFEQVKELCRETLAVASPKKRERCHSSSPYNKITIKSSDKNLSNE